MVTTVSTGVSSHSFVRAPLDWFTTLRLIGDFTVPDQNQKVQELLLDLPHFQPTEFDRFLSDHMENIVSLTHIDPSLLKKLAETLSDLYLSKCQTLPCDFQNIKQSLLYKMIGLKYSSTSKLESAHAPLFFFIQNRILPRRQKEWLETIEKNCLDQEKEQNYLTVLNEIDRLIPFCSIPNDKLVIQKLYKMVQDSFEENNKNTKAALKSVDIKIFNKPPFQNCANSISTHRSNLEAYHTSFPDTPKARFESFRDLFFKPLFTETLRILGEPPCGYDFRAKGSIGRHDMTPSSDLEYLLLIEKDQFTSYFYDLIYLLELQIITLGETSAKQAGGIPPFHGVSDGERFHLDLGHLSQNIGTPIALASHQKIPEPDPNVEDGFDPATGQNMVLKTSRLHSNSKGANLFNAYTSAIKPYLNQKRALGLQGLSEQENRIIEGYDFKALTYIPSTYNKKQIHEYPIKGRTCRQDDPGSIQKILFADDLYRHKMIPGTTNPNGQAVPDLHEVDPNSTDPAINSWDNYLSAKREKKCSDRFDAVFKEQENNRLSQNKCLEMSQAMEQGRRDDAIKLLKEFN